MNRFVKIEGHSNWFLALEPNEVAPEGTSEKGQKRMLSIVAGGLHSKDAPPDLTQRLVMAATTQLDYEALAIKYNTTLFIRPIGSYMTLGENDKIIEERFSNNFPVTETAEIVICENDQKAHYYWMDYLKGRFPDKEIVVINFFDSKSDEEIEAYFKEAKYITFSTTFTDLGWFEKMDRLIMYKGQKIIGHCYEKEMWDKALKVTDKEIEIVTL